jgi:cation diffusion facilitator CzcD-associated flavoprotein CzcO
MKSCDVAIVGAGPYGLSAAAHLAAIDGLDTKLFGEPFGFWERQMPAGMLLRSPYVASHLSDPQRRLTLDAYSAETGRRIGPSIRLEDFIDYGHWFHKRGAPHADSRTVVDIVRDAREFRLGLDDGDTCTARRVVVAAGIAPFAVRPPQFEDVPMELASHASAHMDLSRFAGKQVLVIGGGPSALESAALISEAGGDVDIVVREPVVRWLRRKWRHHRMIRGVFYAWPDVGPPGVSHLVARPKLFRSLPRRLQDGLGPRSLRAAGAAWLEPRCQNVPMRTGCSVLSARTVGPRLAVTLSDGTERVVDHVLLGTGYRVDIARYPFLPPALLGQIRSTNGFPQLDAGFECSVPGLHFIGATSAWSFGPLLRFVAGCDFASRHLARRLARPRND